MKRIVKLISFVVLCMTMMSCWFDTSSSNATSMTPQGKSYKIAELSFNIYDYNYGYSGDTNLFHSTSPTIDSALWYSAPTIDDSTISVEVGKSAGVINYTYSGKLDSSYFPPYNAVSGEYRSGVLVKNEQVNDLQLVSPNSSVSQSTSAVSKLILDTNYALGLFSQNPDSIAIGIYNHNDLSDQNDTNPNFIGFQKIVFYDWLQPSVCIYEYGNLTNNQPTMFSVFNQAIIKPKTPTSCISMQKNMLSDTFYVNGSDNVDFQTNSEINYMNFENLNNIPGVFKVKTLGWEYRISFTQAQIPDTNRPQTNCDTNLTTTETPGYYECSDPDYSESECPDDDLTWIDGTTSSSTSITNCVTTVYHETGCVSDFGENSTVREYFENTKTENKDTIYMSIRLGSNIEQLFMVSNVDGFDNKFFTKNTSLCKNDGDTVGLLTSHEIFEKNAEALFGYT